MPRTTRSVLLAALFFTLAGATAAAATTIVPPRNLGHLARISRSVVLARAGTHWVEDRQLPFTITTFELVEQIGGAKQRASFLVEVPGGALADRAAVISGAPQFEEGRTYMLFLARAGGRWKPQMLAYGLLEEVVEGELLRPLPEADDVVLVHGAGEGVEGVAVYRERALVAHLREVLAGAPWDARKVLAPASAIEKLHTKPPLCEFQLHSDNLPLRKFGYETGASMSIFHTTPGQTGIADGGVSAVQQGTAAWTNHPESVINFGYAGSRGRNIACSSSSDVDQGGVVFNDPCSDIADLTGCAGTLAFGGSFYNPSATMLYDGEPWHDVTAAFVVVNNGAQCVGEIGFKEMMTHELGHTQGFGHHTDPQATMAAVIKNDGRGASLFPTDKACASYAYHTYLDVPYNYWAWRFVEAQENAGIMGGCGGGNFCPGTLVLRQDMAVFLLKGKFGGGHVPPACTTPRFADVPCSSPYAPWVNELASLGVTAGCGGNNYCPTNPVAREEMAIFLLKASLGSTFQPPACTTPRFADVPCSSPYAIWINELARRNITAGCDSVNYCPHGQVRRDEMATFLTRAFALPIP